MALENIYNLSITAIASALKKETITLSDLYEKISIALNSKSIKALNAVVSQIDYHEAIKVLAQQEEPNNLLWAIPYAIKDNFCTQGIVTTASCKLLANYVPPFDSTAVALLKQKQAIGVCKTALDELGMGGRGLYAASGIVHNPFDLKRITGGSSSGSAALVASGLLPFALATDTGDSIRKPASYCGLVGFKPSYGLISRLGVIPYAPSLDTVGCMTRNVTDTAIVLDSLACYDPQDATSRSDLKPSNHSYYQALTLADSTYKVCVLAPLQKQLSSSSQIAFEQLTKTLEQEASIQVATVPFDEKLLQTIHSIYMILSYAEAVSTHSNLDGINFGVRKNRATYQETMRQSRSLAFNKVVQERFVLGSYCLHQENQKNLFLKAKKIRTLINQVFSNLFCDYDIVLWPAANGIAPLIETAQNTTSYEANAHKNYLEHCLIIPNFLGSPSLTVPWYLKDKMPVGININGQVGTEQKVLNFGLLVEKITGLSDLSATNLKKGNINCDK